VLDLRLSSLLGKLLLHLLDLRADVLVLLMQLLQLVFNFLALLLESSEGCGRHRYFLLLLSDQL
jgi:hypothetical protein